FLIGLQRSGTTLVKQLVDSHSHITCPPETFFLSNLVEQIGEYWFNRGMSSMGFDEEGAINGLKCAADYYFGVYMQAKGKIRWADKTPNYVAILPVIERMYGPRCQYVMIYRHPFDIMQS